MTTGCTISTPTISTWLCARIVFVPIGIGPEIDGDKVGHERRYLALHNGRVAPNDVLVIRFRFVALNYHYSVEELRAPNRRREATETK